MGNTATTKKGDSTESGKFFLLCCPWCDWDYQTGCQWPTLSKIFTGQVPINIKTKKFWNSIDAKNYFENGFNYYEVEVIWTQEYCLFFMAISIYQNMLMLNKVLKMIYEAEILPHAEVW